MIEHEKINYIELPATDLKKAKYFFGNVFGWQFVDYGDDYVAFANAGIDGGFYRSDKSSTTDNGATLVVFYSNDLEDTLAKIQNAGGQMCKPIFQFPGGRRFHFKDLNGNEYAVWSDKGLDE